MSNSPTLLEHKAGRDHRVALVVALVFVLVGAAAAMIYVLDDDASQTTNVIQGSGVPASESRTVGPFDSVELSGSNEVTIRVGEKQSVLVSGDDNLVGRVTTDVSADTLVIGTRPGSFTTQVPMKVEIGVPSLSALTLSGSGNITAEGVAEPSVTVVLSGSGTVQANGAADTLDVTVSGSGEALLDGLVAKVVRALVSGSGLISVTANESLDASVPGSGTIEYSGDPSSVTKEVTGSGEVAPK